MLHMMSSSPIEEFLRNRQAVCELLEIDSHVTEIAVQQLRQVEKRNAAAWETFWRRAGELGEDDEFEMRPHLSIGNVITNLERIRDHGSLRPRYDVMVNQCVVLLVAHFSSAARGLFRAAVRAAVEDRSSEPVLAYEVKARAGDLHGLDHSVPEFIADQISGDISFQDMQSIARSLRQYFGAEIKRDLEVNDLVVAHAARHVIVHSGPAADTRFMKQIRDANPRSLLLNIREGGRIQFLPAEVHTVADAMHGYLCRMQDGLAGRT